MPIATFLGIKRPLSREDFATIVLTPAAKRRPEFADHSFTADTVDAIEGNAKNLRFIDLQLYADVVGVPVGLLLLYSRMKSIERGRTNGEDNGETNEVFVDALREIAASIDPSTLPITTLGEWAAIARKHNLQSPNPPASEATALHES